MKSAVWLLLLSAIILLTGCNSNVSFLSEADADAPWYKLASRVDDADEGKIHVRGKKIKRDKKDKKRMKRAKHDLVKPEKDKKPIWKEQLDKEKEVKVHIDGKAQVRQRGTVSDMVRPKKAKRAPWVNQLKQKFVTPQLKGKKSKRVETSIQTDMVGDRQPIHGKKVDIIFSVDTSESMYEFLSQAEFTFDGFVQELAPLDWRIFFVNADNGQNGDHLFAFNSPYGQGRLIPLEDEDDGEFVSQHKCLSKEVKNYESIFINTISHHAFDKYSDYGENYVSECDVSPGCGGWNEQPLANLESALMKNKKAFRSDAHKAVIVISDNDEGENYTSHVGKKVTPKDIVKVFKKLYKNHRWVTYGVLLPPGDQKCQKQIYSGIWSSVVDRDDYSNPTSLAKLAKLTGGVNFSLCEESYRPLASKIVADFK